MKKLFIVLLILLFIFACVLIWYKESFYNVLEIKSPSCIVIDLNHNNAYDPGEEIHLDGVEISFNDADNLSEEEKFIFNELAKNYVKELFFNKKVRYNKSCIYIDNKGYIDEFNKSGFNSKTSPDKYKELINYIRSNDFYIVNLHNLKAHKYGCKFALKAENYGVFAKELLPLKSEMCKLCESRGSLETIAILPNIQPAGKIKIFYTDFTTKLKPDKNCDTALCKELLSRIDNAKKTIDIAVYGYRSVPKIETAIKSALSRGVKIRLVYDLDRQGNSVYEDTANLADIISDSVSDYTAQQSVKNSYSNIIMHNKFYIFDDEAVITGSANLSSSDMSGFNANTAVVIDSPAVAAVYKAEFEQMFNNKFHTQKAPVHGADDIKLDDSLVSVYFSPQDKITQNHILPLIKNAKKYIYIPAFLITDRRLADELIAAKNRNVEVKIILDALNAHSKYSQIKYLRTNGIEVKAENYAGKLHSKMIIIDDEITVLGSMNFSKSGQNYNDENVLVIRNHQIAAGYREFFEYLWGRIDDWWLMYIPRTEAWESIGSCTDGVDNNYDGMIDDADAGCKLQ